MRVHQAEGRALDTAHAQLKHLGVFWNGGCVSSTAHTQLKHLGVFLEWWFCVQIFFGSALGFIYFLGSALGFIFGFHD